MGKRKNKNPSQSPKSMVAVAKKEKRKNKQKKTPKNEFDMTTDFNSFQSEINQLKEQALTEHKEAIKIANKNYNSLIDSIDKSDIILQVLDARDPHGCRILEIEKLIKEKGKKLIDVINKSDLIPKEVALRWLGDPSFQIDDLSQLTNFNSNQDYNILNNFNNNVIVAAISSKADAEQKQACDLLFEIIDECSTDLQNLPTISIIGINHVGKSTICSFLNSNNDGKFNQILEVPSYAFISSTDIAALLNAIEYRGDMSDFWIEFADRTQDDSIFDVLAIEPTDDIDEVIKEYAKVIHKNVTEATDEITNNLLNGSQHFFSIPEDTAATSVREFQQTILDSLSSADNGDDSDSIHINRGQPLIIDNNLLKKV